MTIAAIAQSRELHRQSTITLGMAQLAPRGISEDWWLKHLGDVHWRLIADAMGQNTTVFRDNQGRHLYAAFCATQFKQFQPDIVGLGHKLEVHSELWAAGRSRVQSNHHLLQNGIEVAQFKLVSTFVAHMETGLNASLRRATPYLIPVLEPAPDDFAKYTSQLAKEQKSATCNPKSQISLPTHIGTDFNAVGLLYFPSFTCLFEQTEVALSRSAIWAPVTYRKVLYFGNVEMGEPVLGCSSGRSSGEFELWTALGAGKDKRMLACCSVRR